MILTISISLFSGCGGAVEEIPTDKAVQEPTQTTIKQPADDTTQETEVNNNPTANIVDKITREEGVSINFSGNADDVDNDILSFKWQEGETILSTNQNFTKDNFSPGEHNITFTVTDAHGESASDNMTITIVQSNTINDAPTALDLNITTDEDNAITFKLETNDVEGDALTMTITSAPSHGELKGLLPNFTYTPDANFHGSDKITYTVNDGNSNSSEATVNISIRNVNNRPTVNAGEDKKMRAGHTSWISATANDNDGDIVSYNWTKNGKLLSTKPSFRYTPTTLGAHELKITVTDNENSTATDTIAVNVTNKLPLVVIRVEFNKVGNEDGKFHSDASVWSQKIFGTDEGELNHYYNEISYGRLQFEKAKESYGVQNDGIITISLNEDHPGNGVNFQEFLPRVIKLTDNYIDYSMYDINKDKNISKKELQIMFLVAGGENATRQYPGIWAHAHCIKEATILDNTQIMGCGISSYSIFGERHKSNSAGDTHDATIGIIAHELGHAAAGLIDLYDIDGSSQGIGNFGLMGAGNWGRKSWNEKAGTTPIHMTGWSKIQSKFIEPISILNDISLEFIQTSDENYKLYKIPTKHEKEYFLIENRANSGYDRGLFILAGGTNFTGGLSILHIDDNLDKYEIGNMNEAHKKVDIEEANDAGLDNNTTHRGHVNNLYFSGNSDNFTPTTTPNSNLYDETSSGLSITNISDTGASMSADIEIQ